MAQQTPGVDTTSTFNGIRHIVKKDSGKGFYHGGEEYDVIMYIFSTTEKNIFFQIAYKMMRHAGDPVSLDKVLERILHCTNVMMCAISSDDPKYDETKELFNERDPNQGARGLLLSLVHNPARDTYLVVANNSPYYHCTVADSEAVSSTNVYHALANNLMPKRKEVSASVRKLVESQGHKILSNALKPGSLKRIAAGAVVSTIAPEVVLSELSREGYKELRSNAIPAIAESVKCMKVLPLSKEKVSHFLKDIKESGKDRDLKALRMAATNSEQKSMLKRYKKLLLNTSVLNK